MNTLQIVSIALSMVCVVITTILAWVAIAKAQKVQVTFAGTPVDKKDCASMMLDAKEKIDDLFAKVGGVERGVEGRLNIKLDAMSTNSSTTARKSTFASIPSRARSARCGKRAKPTRRAWCRWTPKSTG